MTSLPPTDPLTELTRRLEAGSLPGVAAHRRMWPAELPARDASVAPHDSRRAAVLLLLYADDGELTLPLIRRTKVQGDVHSGQISLPGGSREGRETPEETARRETAEELGCDLAGLRILGRLSPLYISVSGYRVLPVVGSLRTAPRFHPDVREVAAVLPTRLSTLADPRRLGTVRRRLGGAVRAVPCWRLGTNVVWGATALILAELLSILGTMPPPARVPADGRQDP